MKNKINLDGRLSWGLLIKFLKMSTELIYLFMTNSVDILKSI